MKTKFKLLSTAFFLALFTVFVLTNCTKVEDVTKEATIPVLTTNEITEVTQTTALSGGVISAEKEGFEP